MSDGTVRQGTVRDGSTPPAPDDIEKLRIRLAQIAKLEPTIDLTKRDSFVAANGWHVDAREIALPAETPGAPTPSGSFAAACDVLLRYAFPPPRLIRGRFDPDAPLAQRAMLLTATFLWMTFELPVRVTRVIDELRHTVRGDEQTWGYSYETLSGHLERGEITFEVVKHLGSGQILFRIHSFSQTAQIANLIYRWGFRLVGRMLQRRFAEESLQNMRQLVTVRLASAPRGLAIAT